MDSKYIKFYDPDGPMGWLANFSSHSFLLNGRVWPTVEHFYQAQKFSNSPLGDLIYLSPHPSQAKQLAKEFRPLRNHFWNDIKEHVMFQGIEAKYTQNFELGLLLVSTGNLEIIEDSETDYYWGCGRDKTGLNRMGKLLMALREKLISQ